MCVGGAVITIIWSGPFLLIVVGFLANNGSHYFFSFRFGLFFREKVPNIIAKVWTVINAKCSWVQSRVEYQIPSSPFLIPKITNLGG